MSRADHVPLKVIILGHFADRGSDFFTPKGGICQARGIALGGSRTPPPPTPSPKRRGGERQVLLPPLRLGEGVGGGVSRRPLGATHPRTGDAWQTWKCRNNCLVFCQRRSARFRPR